MKPNPVLKKLGFSDTDRAVILHVDDVGMCEATLSAFDDLMDFGLISSAAVMVPCPWFPQTAAYCRKHPEVDMGVHLTLNSEWDGYRWGPISTRDSASGLMNDEGYFYRRQPPVQAKADTVELNSKMESSGVPLLDHEVGLPLDKPANRVEQAKHILENLPIGITHFYMHAAKDTPELRAIAPDWESRVADYHAF